MGGFYMKRVLLTDSQIAILQKLLTIEIESYEMTIKQDPESIDHFSEPMGKMKELRGILGYWVE
jgi:hypothetical protein